MDDSRTYNLIPTPGGRGKKSRKAAVDRMRIDIEEGVIRKSWSKKLPIALIYPNSYRVGMANLGFQALYSLMNRHPDVVCERFFLPGTDRGGDYGHLKSEETGKPLKAFSVLAFSISFENDFINVLNILSNNGVPPENSRRGESNPLVIAGGVAVSLNPEPIADFIDFFVLGEAELIIDNILEVLVADARESEKHETTFSRVSELPGVYVPRFYRAFYSRSGLLSSFKTLGNAPARVKAGRLADIRSGGAISRLYSPEADFGRMFLMETGRGCGRKCRFCAAGFIYLPPRIVSFESIKDILDQVPECLETIGLVGTALSDHPQLEQICEEIVKRGKKASLSSLRADQVTPRLVKSIKASGHRTVALAPEAGTERLRSVIRKGLKDEQIIQAVSYLLEGGIPNIRLYFMIGLPTETTVDIDAIPSLVKKIRHVFVKRSKAHGRIGQITLSINPFVPKPHTPFQWHKFETVPDLKAKLKSIRRALQSTPNVQVHHDVPKWSYMQAVMSRGDRRVGRLLLEAVRINNWGQALRSVNINTDFYVCRNRDENELFPWDFIDHGVDKSSLLKQYHEALKEI